MFETVSDPPEKEEDGTRTTVVVSFLKTKRTFCLSQPERVKSFFIFHQMKSFSFSMFIFFLIEEK